MISSTNESGFSMSHRCGSALVCLVAVLASSTVFAQSDRVRTTKGTETGEVTKMTAIGVTVTRGSTTKEVPVTEIRSVQFADEPSELTQARVNARNGGYQSALKKLRGVGGDIANPYVKQDLAFYRAYCLGKLALLGEGDPTSAGRELNKFRQQNQQSFHYLDCLELLGDLLAAAGRFPQAEKMYAEMARAPFPAYKARAGVLTGRALQSQDKHDEAVRRFDTAIGVAGQGPENKSQRLAAQLGKAVSLSATGKVDQGVKLAQQVIRDADPEDQVLLAQAYAALGACYREGGKAKDALFAYLRVDLLFANVPSAHAEALFNLATLWESIGKPQQARQARNTLKQQYAASSWAKKL